MATVKDIYHILDQYAPFATQMGFDNAGFLVGRAETEVTKVLLTLDITLPVIDALSPVIPQVINCLL